MHSCFWTHPTVNIFAIVTWSYGFLDPPFFVGKPMRLHGYVPVTPISASSCLAFSKKHRGKFEGICVQQVSTCFFSYLPALMVFWGENFGNIFVADTLIHYWNGIVSYCTPNLKISCRVRSVVFLPTGIDYLEDHPN